MCALALTPEEVSKHKRAIEKIKRKLFARHTPTEYGIVPGSEEIIGATAEERWCASIGEYRKLTLGGVRFTLQIGSSRYSMTVLHVERDVLSLHVSSERGYTELVVSRGVRATREIILGIRAPSASRPFIDNDHRQRKSISGSRPAESLELPIHKRR